MKTKLFYATKKRITDFVASSISRFKNKHEMISEIQSTIHDLSEYSGAENQIHFLTQVLKTLSNEK